MDTENFDSEVNSDTTVSDTASDTTSEEKNIETLEEELKIANEELSKLKEKDLNFSNLRQQKDKAEDKAKTLEEKISEKVDEAKQEIIESNVDEYLKEQLNELSGDDEELKKKIEFQYNRIKDTASTKAEVSQKLRDSWTLATAGDAGEVNSGTFSSGGVSGIKPKNTSAFTAEEKALAQKLASAGGLELKDEDF